MSETQEKYLGEVEKLVQESQEGLEKAKRLLASLREPKEGSGPAPAAVTGPERSAGPRHVPVASDPDHEVWLDLAQLARIEITSEMPGHPVTSAFCGDSHTGWRAQESGQQVIRLVFDSPQSVKRVLLEFREAEEERTQEFVLRWLPQGASEFRDIVRQEYVFSPGGSTRELEDYRVDLPNLVAIELRITPDLGNRKARASLSRWRMA